MVQLRVECGEVQEFYHSDIGPVGSSLSYEQRLLVVKPGVNLRPQLGRVIDLQVLES